MVADPVLQWVLTLPFSSTALYSCLRLVRDRKLFLVVGDGLHLVMSLAMIAMCWPWWSVIPALPLLFVFIVGTIWFVLVAALQSQRRIPRASVGGHSAWHQVAHAIMMLAMVWMILAMPSGTDSATHTHHHGSLDLWAALTGVSITAALGTTGVVFLVELSGCLRGRTTWLDHTGDVASGTLMSLGMAAMCWLMIAG